MEDLTRHWNCLSLSKREGDDLCFKKDRCSKEYIIAAQFLTKWALNMEEIAKTFKPLWRVDNGFTVSKEGSHKVLVVFDNKEDVDRILSSEPWSFEKNLVVLDRFERQTPLDDLKFDNMTFWVQEHNIPIGYRSKSVAEDICEAIGRVDRSTKASDSEGGNYVRVRVTMDVCQPLCQGRVVTFEEGGKTWAAEGVKIRTGDKDNAKVKTNQSSMAMSNMSVDYVDFQASKSPNPAPMNSNKCLVARDHRNKGESFTQKLREIDKELRIYEDPLNLVMNEIEAIQMENDQNFNMGEIISELAPTQNTSPTPPKMSQPIKTHASVLHDVTNSHHAPMHVENPSQTKWKHPVREPVGTTHTQEESIGLKRPSDMVVDPSELPCKKILVSHEEKENFQIMAEAIF
uniref:DUF4283 domain-containing protein n=1 Tax=Quercus lobata TaxID=97700 RepID=A0A7N2LLI2_QUELO